MAAQAAIYGGLAGLQLAGSYYAAQNVREQARLNRDIAEMNAEFAEIDAWQAERDGESRAAQYQSVIDKTLSDQRTVLAAADVDINYGSAATIAEESEFVSQLNLTEIKRQAEEQALGYESQARQYRLGGELGLIQADVQASQIMFQGLTGAAQSGLTGYERSL